MTGISVTGVSVMSVLRWCAGAPIPTLATGSVATLLKLTKLHSLVQSLVHDSGQCFPRTAGPGQHPGQGLLRTAGLAQHPGQGLPRTAGLVQHPGQGLPRTAGPAADQGEMRRLVGVGFGCFYFRSCFLICMHNVTSCTMSHRAQCHIVHNVICLELSQYML